MTYKHCKNRVVGPTDRLKVGFHEISDIVQAETIQEVPVLHSGRQWTANTSDYTLASPEGSSYQMAASQTRTPRGKFTVVEKWEQPYWRNATGVYIPGENNPIGEYLVILADDKGKKVQCSIHKWPEMPFSDSDFDQGDHGTGCLRLREKDMKRMFKETKLGDTIQIQ
mgnify:CR=1 FL=1|jgi:lipoprotein-anchoring transpeptidase ErfK/SrfK